MQRKRRADVEAMRRPAFGLIAALELNVECQWGCCSWYLDSHQLHNPWWRAVPFWHESPFWELPHFRDPPPPKRMQALGLGLHYIWRAAYETGDDKTTATLWRWASESFHCFAECKASDGVWGAQEVAGRRTFQASLLEWRWGMVGYFIRVKTVLFRLKNLMLGNVTSNFVLL